MSWVDCCILGIVVLSMLVGVLRGFARELLGLMTWIAAVVASAVFGATAAEHLSTQIANPALRSVAGHALVFFGALFVGAVLTHLVGVLIRSAGAGGMDRTLGAGFGLLRGVFVVVLVVMIAGSASPQAGQWWRDSQLVPPLLPLADALRSLVPERWISILKSPDFAPSADVSGLTPPSYASPAQAAARGPSPQAAVRSAEGS